MAPSVAGENGNPRADGPVRTPLSQLLPGWAAFLPGSVPVSSWVTMETAERQPPVPVLVPVPAQRLNHGTRSTTAVLRTRRCPDT